MLTLRTSVRKDAGRIVEQAPARLLDPPISLHYTSRSVHPTTGRRIAGHRYGLAPARSIRSSAHPSELDENLDRAAFVHGALALGDLAERQEARSKTLPGSISRFQMSPTSLGRSGAPAGDHHCHSLSAQNLTGVPERA
jgi:hypothetical protein